MEIMSLETLINELSYGELGKLLGSNAQLYDEVMEHYQDSQLDYLGELIQPFKDSLTNYSIGFDLVNFIEVGDEDLFRKGVLKSTADYGLLGDVDIYSLPLNELEDEVMEALLSVVSDEYMEQNLLDCFYHISHLFSERMVMFTEGKENSFRLTEVQTVSLD